MWHNLDALVVIAVGFGVIGLQIVGEPKPELIDAAILALLATTAIVLLRDRIGRDDLTNLRQLAGDAISDRPYEVVWQENEWDIRSREHSTMRMTQHRRIMRVTWPADAAPSHVEIKFKGAPARTLSTRRKDGRPYIEEKIAHLAIGEVVEIAWTW